MSQFIRRNSEFLPDDPQEIDFDDAVRLGVGGSTCDVYRTRWQRREVLVKRLKEELRSKPLYLDALDKEFDIGVRLRHRSLPEYREFHRDYIVMDYIDGLTLAEMIRRDDPWLRDERNIVKMLRELVDVVDYLHCQGVVHCDIKPDNIMITARGRNLVLIDFDKSYTDALNDTSGHPAMYGLPMDQAGSISMDFNGIGMVVERLKAAVEGFRFSRSRRFLRACYGPDADCAALTAILDYEPGRRGRKWVPVVAVGVVVAVGGIIAGIYLNRGDDEAAAVAREGATQSHDSVPAMVSAEEALVPEASDVTMPDSGRSEPDNGVGQREVPATLESGGAVGQDELLAEARKRASLLDDRIRPAYNDLLADLDRIVRMKDDASLSGRQMLESVRRHCDRADECREEALAILRDMYPGLTDREAWRILAYSKVYTGYTRRANPELMDFRREYERRFQQEGVDESMW